MPLVSVVIPVHNPGSFLERALRSVLAQTERDLECVIVDDGSTQELAPVPEFDDPRVRIVRQPNRGVSVARNVGVDSGDSRYVAFLDQDDQWLPSKLERQARTLARHPEAAFSYTGFTWMLPTGEVPSGLTSTTGYHQTLGGMDVLLSSVVVERVKHNAVGGHHPLLVQAQDWDFVLRLLLAFGAARGEKEHLVRYFVHGANASSDYWAAERETRTIARLHGTRARRVGDERAASAIRRGAGEIRTLHAHQAMDGVRAGVRGKDWRGASVHLARGLALDPVTTGRFALSAAWSARQGLRAGIRRHDHGH